MGWFFYMPLVPLAVLAVQDFRTRTVSVVWLVAFGLSALGVSLWIQRPISVAMQAGLNLLLLLYLSGGVWLWLHIRYGKNARPLGEYIGLGDICLLLFLTPCFTPRAFLLFLIVSLIAGLLFYGLVRLVSRRKPTVPLVGMIGITFTLYVLIKPLLP